MTNQSDKGVIDLADRVLSQLLNSATFKNNIRLVMNNLDPESARRLVRTVMWRDMEFSLSWVASSPALINTVIKLVDEVLNQINDKFPESMLTTFMRDVLADIDRETLDRAREKALSMYGILAPLIEEKLLEGMDGPVEQDAPAGPSPTVASNDPPLPDAASHEIASGEVADGVLGELLRTPFLKQMLRETLADIDPAKGARAARALMWSDMETTMALMGALPAVVNLYISAAAGLGEELNDKMPPGMLIPFIQDLLADIDVETAQKGMAAYQALGRKVSASAGPELTSMVQALMTAPAFTRTLAESVNRGVAGLNRLEADHPGTIQDVMSAVVAETDKKAVNMAVRHLTDAVMAQRPPVFVIAWRTAKAYVRGWFKKVSRR